jgi:hypothetical protein
MVGGQSASRRAKRGYPPEEPVLRFAGEITDHQSLENPCCGPAWVEARVPQCRRPILAQIGSDGSQFGSGFGAHARQCGRLELDHLGLVDLVDDGARGPLQPVGPRVQTRSDDHDLSDATGHRIEKEVVEEQRPHAEEVREPGRPHLVVLQPTAREPGEEVDAGGMDEQFGIRIVDQWILLPGRDRPRRGHHRGGGSHAAGQIPTVVFGTCHVPRLFDAGQRGGYRRTGMTPNRTRLPEQLAAIGRRCHRDPSAHHGGQMLRVRESTAVRDIADADGRVSE